MEYLFTTLGSVQVRCEKAIKFYKHKFGDATMAVGDMEQEVERMRANVEAIRLQELLIKEESKVIPKSVTPKLPKFFDENNDESWEEYDFEDNKAINELIKQIDLNFGDVLGLDSMEMLLDLTKFDKQPYFDPKNFNPNEEAWKYLFYTDTNSYAINKMINKHLMELKTDGKTTISVYGTTRIYTDSEILYKNLIKIGNAMIKQNVDDLSRLETPKYMKISKQEDHSK